MNQQEFQISVYNKVSNEKDIGWASENQEEQDDAAISKVLFSI